MLWSEEPPLPQLKQETEDTHMTLCMDNTTLWSKRGRQAGGCACSPLPNTVYVPWVGHLILPNSRDGSAQFYTLSSTVCCLLFFTNAVAHLVVSSKAIGWKSVRVASLFIMLGTVSPQSLRVQKLSLNPLAVWEISAVAINEVLLFRRIKSPF